MRGLWAAMPGLIQTAMMKLMFRSLPAEEQERVWSQLEQVEAEQDAAGRGSALVGKETPDCRIVRVEDGEEVSLRALEAAGRPLVLNFGSCS